MARDVSSWLPNLLGPLDLQVDGVAVDVPRRSTINLVGLTVEDDPENEATIIEGSPGGGAGTGDASYPIDLTDGAEVTVPATGIVTSNGTALGSFAPGTGVQTFLTTPSGANLATALTSALPASKGGTGINSSALTGIAKITAGVWATFTPAANVETFLTTPSGANLAAALTSALPATKGGTGLTSLGAGIATFLGTPSSANLAAAVTDETGTGALVFANQPALEEPTANNATMTGTTVLIGDTNKIDDTVGNIVSRGNVATTASTTPTTVCSFTSFDGYIFAVDVITTVASFGPTATPRASRYKRSALYYRNGAGLTLVGSIESGTDVALNAGDALTLAISGDDILVRGTAADANSRSWHTEMRIQMIPMGAA